MSTARDKQALRRMQLLARIRAIEHRGAARQALAALDAGRRSRQLADRAQDLAHSYDARRDAETGYDLRAQQLVGVQTGQLARHTGAQAQEAEWRARELARIEREARHRRDRVEEEWQRLHRLAQVESANVGPGRTTQARIKDNSGTDVE